MLCQDYILGYIIQICLYCFVTKKSRSDGYALFLCLEILSSLTHLNLNTALDRALDAGLDCLKRSQTLFKEEGQEVPTLLKMTFNAKTKAFNNEIIYELQFTNHSDKLPDDGADEWFGEIKDSMN